MSFDWSEYFDIAQELAIQAKNNTPHQEAKLRAAISRAYYALFNKARDLLRRYDKMREPDYVNIHEYVREQFKNSAEQDRQQIGVTLDRMRLFRNIADYELTNVMLNNHNMASTTQANLKLAKDALQLLKRLQKP